MVHVAVTWERAETFGWCKCFFTQVLRFGQSIRVEMCPEQLKHFAEHVQFNWRASGSAADSLFPQASWFLTHWGSIHSPLFPKRVSDEWSVELGELGVSPKPRCNHQLGCFTRLAQAGIVSEGEQPEPGAGASRGCQRAGFGAWSGDSPQDGHFKGNMRKINHDQPSIER